MMMRKTSLQGNAVLNLGNLSLDDEVVLVVTTTVKKLIEASMESGHVDEAKLKLTGAKPLKGAEATKYKKEIAADNEKADNARIANALAESDDD